jgi:hypothetical protein
VNDPLQREDRFNPFGCFFPVLLVIGYLLAKSFFGGY